jgi:two-component system, NtrC family, response regulator AtoC
MDSILVIDDEKNVRGLLTKILSHDQVDVHTAGTGAEGLQLADEVDPDVILLDLRLPDADGMDLLKTLKSRRPETAVIIITAYGEIPSVVEAMKYGATDYLEKPFEPLEKLRLAVARVLDEVKARREIHRLHQLQARQYGVDRIVGESESTRRLRQMIRQLAQSEAQTILILGESGTGKELVARGLHYEGPRRDFPFMEVNCAAITDTLFESELFGHEKGSFTDAKATKKGLMEVADRGTLFLDEVSEMSPGSQAKLLRSLQERVVRRVGGTRDIKVDVRIIAATNRALDAQVKDGKFREDLYYRLNVIPITIPPLRTRRDDTVPLARHFLLELNSTFHKTIRGFAPDTEKLFLSHDWPGNVRELKNLIERLVILSTSEWIQPDHLPPPFAASPEMAVTAQVTAPGQFGTLAEMERAWIVQAVQRAKGNKSQAAKLLGISRQTLRKKLEGA